MSRISDFTKWNTREFVAWFSLQHSGNSPQNSFPVLFFLSRRRLGPRIRRPRRFTVRESEGKAWSARYLPSRINQAALHFNSLGVPVPPKSILHLAFSLPFSTISYVSTLAWEFIDFRKSFVIYSSVLLFSLFSIVRASISICLHYFATRVSTSISECGLKRIYSNLEQKICKHRRANKVNVIYVNST